MTAGWEDTRWFKRQGVLHDTDVKMLRGLGKFLENTELLLSTVFGH